MRGRRGKGGKVERKMIDLKIIQLHPQVLCHPRDTNSLGGQGLRPYERATKKWENTLVSIVISEKVDDITFKM